jgi:hypothetical protein
MAGTDLKIGKKLVFFFLLFCFPFYNDNILEDSLDSPAISVLRRAIVKVKHSGQSLDG